MRKVIFGFGISCLAHASVPLDWISFGGGVYDLLRPKHRCPEFEIEYKFHIRHLGSPLRVLEFLPLVGIMANVHGGGYLYAGVNFDFLFCKHIVFAPGFAAGYYWAGKGKNLGFPLEFRSGVELAWQFSELNRLGIHFYHLSNASLGKKNPGEESLVLFYDIPIRILSKPRLCKL
ncbi:MAG TPA: acyloxyacyl hydrolase [Chlamydiales bacterium]|nr:acyloxyacyl hydrolase [Chlamydiales bacterium]